MALAMLAALGQSRSSVTPEFPHFDVITQGIGGGHGPNRPAITSIDRRLKFAKARRVLFLVDTRNLGEQAEQEFMAYQPTDDIIHIVRDEFGESNTFCKKATYKATYKAT